MKRRLYILLISLLVNAFFVFDYLLDHIDGEDPVDAGIVIGITVTALGVIAYFVEYTIKAINKL